MKRWASNRERLFGNNRTEKELIPNKYKNTQNSTE
jgi:hypothetical protein